MKLWTDCLQNTNEDKQRKKLNSALLHMMRRQQGEALLSLRAYHLPAITD